MIPAFQIHLNEKIQRSQATIGKYDGKHPALTCATVAGKIFMHNPHSRSDAGDTNITYLNINKQITAVVAGCLVPSSGRDVLLVGTPSNLQCYDVDQNKDLFFKDVPDGVNAMVAGPFGKIDSPIVLVGGNCSIQGFDAKGTEVLWTVTGDNVSAMAFCDVDGDGRHELLVGSDDFDIRVFQDEDVLSEVSEADQIIGLCPVYLSKFGYALVNGTIGVYDRMERAWRVKSKHSVCALASYDLDGDGVPELISGWNNGRVEVRRADGGDVVYRDSLGCAVSAILKADYRGDGVQQVVVCGVEGEIRGYLPTDSNQPIPEPDFTAQQAMIAELTQKKQELLFELQAHVNTRNTDTPQPEANLIPNSTKVDSALVINRNTNSCDLVLKTNNDTIIRGVVVFGEQVFAEESLFLCPKRTSTCFHVFDVEIDLPKFAMYAWVERGTVPESRSSVTFSVNERIPRLSIWLEGRFHCKLPATRSTESLEASFVCLRDKLPLGIRFATVNNAVQVVVCTDNMDMAGELVTDLAAFLGMQDLSSIADFPTAMAEFKLVLEKVEEYNATRLRMNADMADSSNLIKALLVKAEDARLLGDMKAMRKFYRQLYDLNRDLIAEHDKRATNHSELLKNLKEVNLMIQRAAKLRVGQYKTRVVTQCRAAIKSNNMPVLFKIIKDGEGPGGGAVLSREE